MKTASLFLCIALIALPCGAAAQAKYAGRPLAEVLRELQQRGVNVAFSSELIRPDMRVVAEPAPGSPRRILDAILKPYGLEVQNGPRGTLLVVRARRPPPRAAAGDRLPAGRISGLVVDARTGAPLEQVAVVVEESGAATSTDRNGSFAVDSVLPGTHRLFVSLVGYTLARPRVDVRAGETSSVTVPLADGTGTYTEQVTVAGDTFRAGIAPAQPVAHAITSGELQALRGVLTDDPLRALQTMPGAAAGGDVRSEFSVRGSDFRHIGQSVDGLPTPWLVHNVRHYESDGSVSSVNADVVGTATLWSGARAQSQPERLGAQLDLDLREGTRAANRFHGSVSMTSLSIAAEGPLGSAKSGERIPRGSWLVALRQSYLQWLIKQLGTATTAFGFTDVQSKIVYDVTPTQQIHVGAIAGRSELDQSTRQPTINTPALGDTTSGIAWLRWQSTLRSSTIVTQRVGLAAGRFENTHLSGRTLGSGFRTDVSYSGAVARPLGPSLTIRTGVFTVHQTDDEHTSYVASRTTSAPLGGHSEHVDGTAQATSGDASMSWSGQGGRSFEAGARVSYSTLTHQTIGAPWALAAVPLGRSLTVRGGVSLARQQPDFDQVVGTFGLAGARAEEAQHVDVAVEGRGRGDIRWLVAVYDRREEGLLRLENSETRVVNGQIVFAADQLPVWRNALRGRASGVELLVQRRSANGFSGWAAYTYSHTRYDDLTTGERFDGDYDQRHGLNLFAEDRLSARTSLTLKLRLGTGFPVAGYYVERNGSLYAAPGRNMVRLPLYARLDARADHAFNYRRRRLTLFAEVVNVLNRTNYAVNVVSFLPTGQAIDPTQSQFPILPSVGIRIDF